MDEWRPGGAWLTEEDWLAERALWEQFDRHYPTTRSPESTMPRSYNPDAPYSADNPRDGLPVSGARPGALGFAAAVGIVAAITCAITLWVSRNHGLEEEFAERYSVSNVDVAGGGTDVTWTNTEGSHRCTGRWIEGDLVIRWCSQILPPAAPPAR